jgi:TonB-linked SusC/RagA family outer membrane protein
MLYKRLIMLALLIILIGMTSFAQRTVTGVVFDTDRNTLPGATVVVQGTTVGVTTNIDGQFSLTLQQGQDVLEVSFIGFVNQTVELQGRNHVEVILRQSVEQLQEVVVTALGIRRESKALGYSVQQVDGDALAMTSRINPLSGLVGQVAGLQISESGSGAGGSSRIVLRGANSLTIGNEPLFVIDGVPVSNAGGSSGSLFGGFDYGNAINNINFDDVESISVLKGGAASALYGSRGQNGVILITTKTGSRREGIGVSYQAMASVQTPLIKPDFQTRYSQGSGGNFVRLGVRSWGAPMNGQEVNNFLGQTMNLNPATSHSYDEFFRPGLNIDNTLTVDRRGENTGVLFSASWNQSDGIIRTNELDKKSFNLRYDTKLAEYLSFDARANYVNQTAINRPNLAASPDNPIYLLHYLPPSVSTAQISRYRTIEGMPVVWNSAYRINPDETTTLNQSPSFAASPLLNNPYWATELNTNRDQRHRWMGFANTNIDLQTLLSLPFDLDLNVKAGFDYFNDDRHRIVAHNTYYKAEGRATGNWTRLEFMETNADFLLSGGHQWNDFTLRTSVGGNLMRQRTRSLNSSSESGLINPVGPYVIQNYTNPVSNLGMSDREIQSLYGLLSTDFRRMIFVDFTFRNDWTSTLAADVRSYFYPSVSASWLLEETFTLPESFDMLKLRGSYAATGSDGNLSGFRYFQYGTNPGQYLGLPYGFTNSTRPNFLIRPEYTITQEAGVEMIMFRNRFRADVALFQTGTKDQILLNPLPPSTGFVNGWVNSGYVNNKGIELFTSYRIIDNPGFSWTSSVNFTRQWSIVEEISDEISEVVQSSALGDGGVRIIATIGQPAGVIWGTAFARDGQGRLLLSSENLPYAAIDENQAIRTNNVIGNSTPSILWGFNSTFTFRRFSLGFQIDSKMGHDIFSVSNMHGAEFGTLAFTAEGRDEWYRAVQLAAADPTLRPGDFNMGMRVTGVRPGSNQESDYYVDPQRYWEAVSRIHEAFVYDASFIRMRQLSLSYNFSPRMLAATPIRDLSLSVFANNLFYFMRNTENISPESSFGTGNNIGFEMFAYPEMRSVGLNLRISL